MTDPWIGRVFIYHNKSTIHVGKYTSPMDPMGDCIKCIKLLRCRCWKCPNFENRFIGVKINTCQMINAQNEDFRVWILPSMIEIVFFKEMISRVYVYIYFLFTYIYIYTYFYIYIYISWPVINLPEFPCFVFQLLDLGTIPRFLGWLYVEPFHEHRQWCELARSYWTSHWDKETYRNKHCQLLISKDN